MNRTTHSRTAPKRLFHWLRRFHRDESGVAIVEFAILLPMLLLIFAVIIEGGRMMWSYQAVSAGVRDASRYLARVAPSTICTEGGAVGGFSGELLTIVSKASDGETLFPSSITVNSVTPSLTCIAGTFRNGPAPIVTVSANLTITFPFSGLFVLAGGSRPTINTTIRDRNKVYGL